MECRPLRGEYGRLAEVRAEESDTQASWQREGWKSTPAEPEREKNSQDPAHTQICCSHVFRGDIYQDNFSGVVGVVPDCCGLSS